MSHIAQLYARWLRLQADKREAADAEKDFMAECKAHGYDTKALRKSFKIAETKDDPDVQEHNALVDLYVNSIIGSASEEAA